eukprot:1150263-Pelagomonas_calceolata.AAC.5
MPMMRLRACMHHPVHPLLECILPLRGVDALSGRLPGGAASDRGAPEPAMVSSNVFAPTKVQGLCIPIYQVLHHASYLKPRAQVRQSRKSASKVH